VDKPKPATVYLHAKHGLCDPTLDDERTRGPNVRYDAVAPGPHVVWCTLGGKRRRVATVELKPGVNFDRAVVVHPDGVITLK